MPTSATKRLKHGKSLDTRYYERINALQIQIPGLILLAIGALHNFLPGVTRHTDKFLHLQYCAVFRWYNILEYARPKGLCGKGVDDAYIVFSGILFFTMLRAFMMSYVFTPFGRMQGISQTKPLMRFAEQSWGFTYALTSWSCGMYLFYYSPYWMDIAAFYDQWPELQLEPIFKLYYLMQLAFWLQCILALNLEAKRKDYLQMFGHHILTSTLLIGSYAFNATRVGHAILTLMDFADIFLPLAKMLKYTGHQTLCDGTFVIFLIAWIVTRHYLLVKIILAAHRAQPIKMRSGRNISWIFVDLLAGLEVLICIWSFAIARVLWGILRGGNADDSRSDTEDSDTESTRSLTNGTPLPESATNGGMLRVDGQLEESQHEKKTR